MSMTTRKAKTTRLARKLGGLLSRNWENRKASRVLKVLAQEKRQVKLSK